MKQYYTSGSEAYAPLPAKAPSHLPEDPVKEHPVAVKQAKGISPLVVGAWVLILVLLFGLVFSTMRLFELRTEQAELLNRQELLQQRQDELLMEYEQSIDLEAVAEQAANLGMGPVRADQIQNIELPEQPVVEEPEKEVLSFFAALREMFRDMKEYFS
ncbi:MAG: hypothetical protein IKT58_01670 [Oscillospiraceae bacterium]|nr:hypothetical protein [Oscillospiraceae bacterium]